MNFRNQQHLVPKIISAVCLVLLIGLLGFVLFTPKPNKRGVASRQRQKEVGILAETNEARDRIKAASAFAENKLWKGDEQNLAPAALAVVNRLVSESKLKMIRFQPQKTALVGELNQVPFVLTVEGSYLDALKLTESLEKPENKFVVNLVQIASADPNSDAVTGTIGLSAFIKPPLPDSPPALTTPKKETTNGKS